MTRSDTSDWLRSLGRLRRAAVRRRVRDAIAEELLGTPRSLAVVLGFTAFMLAVGIGYYAPTAGEVPVALWPLYADSAVAVALGGIALLSLVPTVRRGDSVTDAPTSRGLAYLQTVAFVWLVQFGLWPLISLNLAFGEYVAAPTRGSTTGACSARTSVSSDSRCCSRRSVGPPAARWGWRWRSPSATSPSITAPATTRRSCTSPVSC